MALVTESSPFDASVFGRFEQVVEASVYRALPGNSLIGLTDVVSSTRAIEEGRYKAVNMAGAAAITAVMNALPGLSFPFVFGGDGATLVVPAEQEGRTREALARTVTFVREELSLGLRAALVPIAVVRAAGSDVRLAWFEPSPNVRYAMFSGGGLNFAEREMKEGRFAIPAAAPGERPDLTGLSCRYLPVASHNGLVLSLIVKRADGASEGAFARAVMEIIAMLHALDRDGHPVPVEGPPMKKWSAQGLDLETRAMRGRASPVLHGLKMRLRHAVSWLVLSSGLKLGGFDATRYRRLTAPNTDFRKFDDGLRMTLDTTPETADRIEKRLAELRAAGVLSFGTFRQKEALVTCIVPDPRHDDHMHFVDGASGGYALAARMLKAQAVPG